MPVSPSELLEALSGPPCTPKGPTFFIAPDQAEEFQRRCDARGTTPEAELERLQRMLTPRDEWDVDPRG
jgi:guanylate kinase